MKKDRIQIDGEWYVKESQIVENQFDTGDVIYFKGCVYEFDNCVFEASQIQKSEIFDSSYPGIDIKFTNKKTKKEEHWDNNGWFKGLLKNNGDSIIEAKTMLNNKDIELFKSFLKHLVELDWLSLSE